MPSMSKSRMACLLSKEKSGSPFSRMMASMSVQGEKPFRQQISVFVDEVVKDHQTQVGHADVVDIGKGQGHFEINLIPIFDDLIVFAAGVTAGFVHAGAKFVPELTQFVGVYRWLALNSS